MLTSPAFIKQEVYQTRKMNGATTGNTASVMKTYREALMTGVRKKPIKEVSKITQSSSDKQPQNSKAVDPGSSHITNAATVFATTQIATPTLSTSTVESSLDNTLNMPESETITDAASLAAMVTRDAPGVFESISRLIAENQNLRRDLAITQKDLAATRDNLASATENYDKLSSIASAKQRILWTCIDLLRNPAITPRKPLLPIISPILDPIPGRNLYPEPVHDPDANTEIRSASDGSSSLVRSRSVPSPLLNPTAVSIRPTRSTRRS